MSAYRLYFRDGKHWICGRHDFGGCYEIGGYLCGYLYCSRVGARLLGRLS